MSNPFFLLFYLATNKTYKSILAFYRATSTTNNKAFRLPFKPQTVTAVPPPSSDPSHSYGEPNIYNVTVTATDDCGNSSTDSIIIVVYDPSAGFTSGGGWFVPDGDSFIDGDFGWG